MASESEKTKPEKVQEEPETFLEGVLGKDLLQSRWVKPIAALSPTWQIVGAITLLGVLLYIPYLGAVGLWDPWETHYGEVAREMIQRRDYVYPWWESTWFLSKPPLTMWMDVIGMQLVGTNTANGPVGLYTEWGMRMPFALLSILALALLGLAVSRIAGRRAGLATALSLSTMPLYWLLTRQAVTDMPFVATMVCAMSCAIIAQLSEDERHRAGWWYAFYVFCGLSTLAKGLLGFGLPAVILILYAALCAMPWDEESRRAHLRWLFSGAFRREVREGKRPMPWLWGQMYAMKLGTGILVFLAVCAPWYAHLFAFDGLDEEGEPFWYRFLIHDHLKRLAAGVHTTTPGGTFIYFIEQGGYAMFPWVALLPGAFALASRIRLRGGDKRDHLAAIAALWTVFSFCLFDMSATKFHHYVLPVLPGAAILIGLFIDRLWKEGVASHGVSLIFGLGAFILVGKDLASTPKDFTDLFVYNYDRPYPHELVEKPLWLFGQRMLWSGDLITVLLLAFGGYLALDAFRGKERNVLARAVSLALGLAGAGLLAAVSSHGALGPTLALGLAAALVAIYLGYEITRAKKEERASLYAPAGVVGAAAAALIYFGVTMPRGLDALGPTLLQPVNLKSAIGMGFTVGGGLCALAALQRSRMMLFGSFTGVALAFALWFNWGHWVDLSHHWTQRDLFWRYYRLRRPDEPITAFLMNWRGETFYSKNTVKQIKDNAFLARYAALPGRKWALVEHARLPVLKAAVGPGKVVTPIDRDINNKFVLVSIE